MGEFDIRGNKEAGVFGFPHSVDADDVGATVFYKVAAAFTQNG
jgi:hypothetical protein